MLFRSGTSTFALKGMKCKIAKMAYSFVGAFEYSSLVAVKTMQLYSLWDGEI